MVCDMDWVPNTETTFSHLLFVVSLGLAEIGDGLIVFLFSLSIALSLFSCFPFLCVFFGDQRLKSMNFGFYGDNLGLIQVKLWQYQPNYLKTKLKWRTRIALNMYKECNLCWRRFCNFHSTHNNVIDGCIASLDRC